MRRIYLASPYTHPDFRVRQHRYLEVLRMTHTYTSLGYTIFSPIVASHNLTEVGPLPVEFSFWKEWCESFIREWATAFWIAKIPGWKESVGINAEKELVQHLNRCYKKKIRIWTVDPCEMEYLDKVREENEVRASMGVELLKGNFREELPLLGTPMTPGE